MQSNNFEIRNALTRVGDPVEFEIGATKRTGLKLHVAPHALGADGAQPARASFDWKKNGADWTGKASYTPTAVGHYLATLLQDGKPVAGRYFAAITGSEAVACAWVNGLSPGKDDYGDVVRPHHLPFDYHVDIDIDNPQKDFLRTLRELELRFGQTPVPRLRANLFGCRDRFSLWEFSEAETIAGIEKLKAAYRDAGLGPIRNVNIHWCMGNVTMRAIRKCGIPIMSALVTNFEMRDGESREIANGSPLRPYWVHRDDFRKAGRAGGRDPLICTPFSVTIPTEFYRGNVDAHWAPDIALVWDRSVESGDEALRSMEVLDMLCDHNRTGSPYVIPIAIQNFGPPAVYEYNRNTLRYAIEKAAGGKLFFANSLALYDYMSRYERRTPRTVGYIRDFMIGSHLIDKPICHPDVIQVEDSRYHAAWEDGKALPEYLFDYTKPWRYPDSDFLDHAKHGPRPETLSGIRVTVSTETRDGGARVQIRIASSRAVDRLPVAVWRLPVTPRRATSLDRKLDLQAVRTPLLETPHLLVSGPVRTGSNRWTVDISGPPAPETNDRSDHHGIVGFQTVSRPGRTPYTYVFARLRVDLPLRLRVPSGRRVRAETYGGGDFGATDEGLLSLDLKWPRPFARIWGATADQITVDNGAELDERCRDHLEDVLDRYPVPGRQAAGRRLLRRIDGALRPAARYKALAEVPEAVRSHQNRYIDVSGARSVRDVRRWFRRVARPGRSESVLLEAHAYARGHIGGPWRDRADLANVIRAERGIGFDVPMYDYAVCYEPGHRSWQMGRAFTLRFSGLDQYARREVTVFLHAYDYDRLGRSYSIRASHPDVLDGHQAILMDTTWLLPQGPEGRDDPASLFAVRVPPDYLCRPFFNLAVREQYDQKNIDFRKQVPYSVAVSDVWVTVK